MRRALLFDYDGLIVDSETLIGRVFIEVLAQEGVHVGFDASGISWEPRERTTTSACSTVED